MKKISHPNWKYTPWTTSRRREAQKRALRRAWGHGVTEPILNWLRAKEAAAERRLSDLRLPKRQSAESFIAVMRAEGRHEAFAEALATVRLMAEATVEQKWDLAAEIKSWEWAVALDHA